MEAEKKAIVLKGIALSAAYCVAYIALRYPSFDQWFLPAGLRVGALLFFSFRYWPYLLAGDMAALLIVRVPMADRYSVQWAYLSPLLLAPLISIPLYFFRKRFQTTTAIGYALPLISVAMAIWSSLSNNLLNSFLDGPKAEINISGFFIYSIGDFFGILLMAPIFAFIKMKLEGSVAQLNSYGWILASVCFFLIVFITISIIPNSSRGVVVAATMLMIAPTIALTFVYGWPGAAIGVAAANAALAQTLTSTGVQGVFYDDVFLSQIGLLTVSVTLLILGPKISNRVELIKKLSLSERAALEIARSSFLAGERNLRDRVIYLAQMQLMLDDQRKDMVDMLKANGQPQAAMLLNSEAVAHMRAFEANASALYPLKIEEKGLYAAIYPLEFTDFWVGSAEVMYFTRGEPEKLSLDLQLAAYRCLCNAFVLLADVQPEVYRVKIHTWKHGDWRGISIRIRVTPDNLPEPTASSTAAEIDLQRRVKAYGGAYRRRHRNKLHLLLWEKNDHPAMDTTLANSSINSPQ